MKRFTRQMISQICDFFVYSLQMPGKEFNEAQRTNEDFRY